MPRASPGPPPAVSPAALVVLAALVAGCAAPGPPADPHAGEAGEVAAGSLSAQGEAAWAFAPQRPVMLADPGFFELSEEPRRIAVRDASYPAGPVLLRLVGFGEAGWAVLPGSTAELRLAAGGAAASFVLSTGRDGFRLEHPGAAPVRCGGQATAAAGATEALDPAGWALRVAPAGRWTLALEGPPPCQGTILELGHLGTWPPPEP